MDIAERSYKISRRFKREDQIGLGHEIRRSGVSVPSNIAEGFGRHHAAEYVHRLWFANGSNNELQTQLEIGQRGEIVSVNEAQALIAEAEEVGRMLRGLVASLGRA
jgi:four helix bundle protein